MASEALGIEAFRAELDRELREICDEEGWDKNNPKRIGWAFEVWIFNQLNQEGFYDKEDYVLHSHDGGLDIIFPESVNEVTLIQAKYGKGSVDWNDVSSFFNSLELILSKQYPLQENKNHEQRFQLLKKIEQKKVASVYLHFFTTKNVTDQARGLIKHYQDKYKKLEHLDATLTIQNLNDVQKLRHATDSNKYTRIGKIDLSIEDGGSFSFSADGRENITFVADGMELRELFLNHKANIFQKNIREPLKSSKINEGIRATLTDDDKQQSRNFYYYNNGISAICDGFTKRDDKLTIENIQIINGAQTVSALGMVEGDVEKIEENVKKVKVLVKLTVVDLDDDADEKEQEFGDNVIRYNNSQNALKPYDFRSNDPVQKFLKEKFKSASIHYMIKRPYNKKKKKALIDIELANFVKVWHTWLKEKPWETSDGKKLIEQDSLYKSLFGGRNDCGKFWDTDKRQQAIIAIRAFFKIKGCLEKVKKDNAEKDKNYARIGLYEFFALLLFKEWLARQAHGNKNEKAEFYTEWLSDHSLSDDSYEEFLKVVEKVAKAHYDKCVTPHNTVTRRKWGYTKEGAKQEKEPNPDIGEKGFKELFYEEMGWEQ